jgi:CRISPR-associated protein Cmr2
VVYAGGDDLLALLPLFEALACARELQEEFKKAVGAWQPPEGARRPTPSVGMAIAHHTAPLDLTLQATARAERSAKDRYGRDALCVHVLKHSGEEVRVGTHWTDTDGESLVALVEQLVKLLRDKSLSMKFAHAFADEARSLERLPVEGRAAELRRLAKRHRGESEKYGAAKDGIGDLCKRLAKWADAPRGEESERALLGLEEIGRWVLLARFIASGGRDEE